MRPLRDTLPQPKDVFIILKHKYKLFNGVDSKKDLTTSRIEQRQQCWDEKQQLENQGIFMQIKFVNNTPTLVDPPSRHVGAGAVHDYVKPKNVQNSSHSSHSS